MSLSLGLSGCGQEDEPTPTPDVESGNAGGGVPAPGTWQPASNPDFNDERKIVNQVTFAFGRGDFAALEEMATGFRDTRARHRDFGFKIESFYDYFWDYSSWNRENPEEMSPEVVQKLKAWSDAYPESPTPHIALAGFYVSWAWDARGSGWARDVTEESWQLFFERLQTAYEILQAGPEAIRDDPSTWAVLQDVALGLGAERAQAEDIFAEGLASDPGYWHIYHGMAYHLLPRWHGENHRQWHDWLVQAVDRSGLPQDEQDMIHAMVSMRMIAFAYDDSDEPDPFLVSRVDWERLKRGGELLLTHYPDSTRLPSYFFKVAAIRGDVDAIRTALKKMNLRYDRGLWSGRDDSEFFAWIDRLRGDFPELQPLLGKAN